MAWIPASGALVDDEGNAAEDEEGESDDARADDVLFERERLAAAAVAAAVHGRISSSEPWTECSRGSPAPPCSSCAGPPCPTSSRAQPP